MKERGLSAIVATVLVILLVIGGVTIVWVGVLPLFDGGFGDVNMDVSLDVVSSGQTVWDSSNRLAMVQVERGADESDLIGMDLIFNLEDRSVMHYVNRTPDVNAVRTYYVNLSNYSGELFSVGVAGVFVGGIRGPVLSELEVGRIDDENISEMIENDEIDGDLFEEPNGNDDVGGGDDGCVVTSLNDSPGCYGDDVYWFNNCGDVGLINESCSDGCSDGVCKVVGCIANCTGKVCGNDDCGESCPPGCGDGFYCSDGECLEGEVYYVDAVYGNDSNAGTSDAPWQTIERAMANWAGDLPAVTFGDTVKLRDGNYGSLEIRYSSPAATSWSDKITYTADDGHDPIIEYLYIVNYHFYIEFNNIKIRQAVNHAKGIYTINAKSLRFINLDIEGVWNTDYSDMEEKDSNGYDALSGTGIYISGGAADNLVDDITIQGCEISKCKSGITIAAYIGDANGECLIDDNEIHTTATSQLLVDATNPGTNGAVTVSNNHIHDLYQFYNGVDMSHASGIAIKACNMTIENNIIHATGSSGGIYVYQNCGEPNVGYSDILIQNNLVYDMISPLTIRLWDISDTGSVIFRNNTVIGYHKSSGYEGDEYYGTVMNVRPFGWLTADGIAPGNCSGLEIYNNIVVGKVQFDDDQGAQDGLNSYSEDYNYFYSATDDGAFISSHDNTVVASMGAYDDVFESGFFVSPDYSPSMHRLNLNDGYYPLMSSSVCDGSVVPWPGYVGALECV